MAQPPPSLFERVKTYRWLAENLSSVAKNRHLENSYPVRMWLSTYEYPGGAFDLSLTVPVWLCTKEHGNFFYEEFRPYLQQFLCIPDGCFSYANWIKQPAPRRKLRLMKPQDTPEFGESEFLAWDFTLGYQLYYNSRVLLSTSHQDCASWVETQVSCLCFPGLSTELANLVTSYTTDMKVGIPEFGPPLPETLEQPST